MTTEDTTTGRARNCLSTTVWSRIRVKRPFAWTNSSSTGWPTCLETSFQTAAKSGYVRVNGEPVKSNHKVKPEDVVTVELPQPVYEFELLPEPMDLDVVHEDDHVLVINKPMNMVVHPGHGNYSGTLVNGVLHHFQSLPSLPNQPEPRPGLVHRLDKDTTGLMVLGKTERALTELSEQFFERTVNRRYWALVWGDVFEDGTVTGHVWAEACATVGCSRCSWMAERASTPSPITGCSSAWAP